MLVRNEEQWVWYAIRSVLPYIKKILVYDTGSIDKTIEIVRSIKSSKIHLTQKGLVTLVELVSLRNEQIQETQTDWFMLLDGDEVWTKTGMIEALNMISQIDHQTTALISPSILPLGDLFHFQEENAGGYELKGKRGHFNIRFYRKREGWSWKGKYPLEAYCDKKEIPVQKKPEELEFLSKPYWHMTHLRRSTVDTHRKYKLEIGKKKNYLLPEVFFKTRPDEVPSPWIYFTPRQKKAAQILSPFRALKRRLILS